MGADKFKKRKKEQRRRSEKLRRWKSQKEEAKLKKSENYIKETLFPSSSG